MRDESHSAPARALLNSTRTTSQESPRPSPSVLIQAVHCGLVAVRLGVPVGAGSQRWRKTRWRETDAAREGSGAVGLVLDLDLVARGRHGPLLGPAPGDETTVAEEEPVEAAGRHRIRDTDLGHLDLGVLRGTSARP